MPKFLIHIIGLNRIDMTKKCLWSVVTNSNDYALVLTNNGSNDGTLACFTHLQHEIGTDRCFVIDNGGNEGFIGPNNKAFELAKEKGYTYFIALNNDTEVPSGWLDLLAAPLDKDDNGALSGPEGTSCSLHGNMHGYPGHNYEYVEGSCLCAKVELVSRYGPLFSDYLDFIYGDDSDLSLRMREKGHNIYRVPFSLKHSQGSTVEHSPEVKTRCQAAQERNHEVLLKCWGRYLKNRRFDYPIVIRRKYALGDVLLTTPIIRAIKESNPLSPILVETDSSFLFHNNPDVCAAASYIPLTGDDLLIDLDMAYENRPETHIVDAYAEAAREKLPGLGVVKKKTALYPSESDRVWAKGFLTPIPDDHRICVIHAGPSNWPGKTWHRDRFQEVIDSMWKKWSIIMVGATGAAFARTFQLQGKTSPLQLAALLNRAHLFIGIDSFPMHVAQAMGCPTIGIFGVSSSKFIMTEGSKHIGLDGDFAIPCTGQRHRESGRTFLECSPDCINSVTVDQVLAAVERISK